MTGKLCVFHGKLNFFWVKMVLPHIFLASFPSTTVPISEAPEQGFQFPGSCWEWASSHVDFHPEAGWVDHSVPPSSPPHALLVSPEPHFCVRCSGSQFLQSTPTALWTTAGRWKDRAGLATFFSQMFKAQMQIEQQSFGNCYSCVLIATLLKIDFMFYRVLVDSQQNGGKGTEISHESPAPLHAQPPPPASSPTRVGHSLS